MIRRNTILLAGLGAAWCLSAATAWAQVPALVTPEAIAHQLETKLNKNFTTTNLRVEVMPFDDPCYLQQGRLQWVLFSADALTQEPVTIRDVFVKVLDVTLDLNQLFSADIKVVKLTPGRSITGARITEDDLNHMIGPDSAFGRQSGMENLKMELRPGEIKITGKYRPLFGSAIELTGTLDLQDRENINFVPTGAKLNGMALPSSLLKLVLKRLNPLVDFRTVPLAPTVDEVTILDHEVRIVG